MTKKKEPELKVEEEKPVKPTPEPIKEFNKAWRIANGIQEG